MSIPATSPKLEIPTPGKLSKCEVPTETLSLFKRKQAALLIH